MKWVRLGVVGLGMSLFSGAALAEHPEIIVNGKGHRYVVWLKPTNPDGSVPPLLAENVTYYCSVAEGFARRMWQLTNGRHYVFQVEYHYDDQAPARYDVEWTRGDGVATGGSVIQMNDAVVQATHHWTEGSDPDGITETSSTRKVCSQGVCVHATCPDGFTIQDNPFGCGSSAAEELRAIWIT